MDYVKLIEDLAKDMGEIRIMEVCGGHTNTIMKYGIRDVLPKNIRLISGPGCPVCVTSQYDIDCMIELALKGVKVATYGDMIMVPGTKMSLKDAQAQGADVKTIYSIDQISEEKDRVFFAVGFETTTPMTAKLLDMGVTVYSTHKVMPPAMRVIVSEMNIHGFIDPGHVSTIVGSEMWDELDVDIPQVICGFKPKQLIKGIYELIKLISEKKNIVLNEYPEVVLPQGNKIAKALIAKTMKPADSSWRGIGVIPLSGLEPRDDSLNAKIKFKELLKNVTTTTTSNGCRCGEIIRGLIEPRECKFFGKECTPENPMGACMVSESEGACAIAYKYGRSLSEK